MLMLVAGAFAAGLPLARAACSPVYGQCGGVSWTGPTCCQAGSHCEAQANNAYYSQCLPDAPVPGCSPWWGQCGGRQWEGPTCCQPGSRCVPQVNGGVLNVYYSQCIPGADGARALSVRSVPDTVQTSFYE